MSYNSTGRLGVDSASKLGHLLVTKSRWVNSLVDDFEDSEIPDTDLSQTDWLEFNGKELKPLSRIWAVDGSYVSVKSGGKIPKEVAFVKTALLNVNKAKLDEVDKEHPHPLLLQDIMSGSAVFHATVFPLRNVKSSLGSNYDAIRNIVNDSVKVDENGAFYETLKWLVYKKWSNTESKSPAFDCPCCGKEVSGLSFNEDERNCPYCNKTIFLTDMIGFHLDMDEDSAPDAVASSYMLVMELLMLFTAIRILWSHSDKSIISDTLFIKDGPLTLGKQYSKLVPSIREFLQFAKDSGRPIYIIGQEKSGKFVDHLTAISMYTAPYQYSENLRYYPLTHQYVRREVQRRSNLGSPYGKRSNWGEKIYVKLDPTTNLVLSIPTGAYNESDDFPKAYDLIGLNRILATLPSLISRRFESALYPLELANGIASMSSYPSAKILQDFLDKNKQ